MAAYSGVEWFCKRLPMLLYASTIDEALVRYSVVRGFSSHINIAIISCFCYTPLRLMLSVIHAKKHHLLPYIRVLLFLMSTNVA